MRDVRFLHKAKYSASRALVIGINAYQNVSPLSYACNDASAIRDLLVSEFGFPEGNVTCLLDADATRANILRSFFRFANDDVGLDDRIVVFFAGHGHTLSGTSGAFWVEKTQLDTPLRSAC